MRLIACVAAALALLLPCGGVGAQPAAGLAPTPVSARALVPKAQADPGVESILQQIDLQPNQAGHWLDLAVILCQKGRSAETQKVLVQIEVFFAPPEGVQEVINLLRQTPCGEQPGRPRLSISAHRGHDSNVNQGSSVAFFEQTGPGAGTVLPLLPAFLPMGDHFTLLDANLGWGQRDKVQYSLLLRERRLDKLAEFDTRILALSAEHEWPCGTARCATGASFGRIELGGKAFQDLGGVQLARSHPLPWGGAVDFETGLSWQKFPNQHHLDAWSATGKLGWRSPLMAAGQVQLALNLGLDQPTGARPGGKRTLSGLTASGSHAVGWDAQAEWLFQTQLTRDSEIYSPGLIDLVRRPNLRVASLAWVKPVTSTQRLRLELRQAQNQDTVTLFSYRSRGASVSWQWRGEF